ncbi:MAG: hypothetical protein ACI4D7_14985, partial [Lachnospiraceae bacterium]
KEKTKIQLRNAKNPQVFINFNGELAKSTHHSSEISKRSPGIQEAPVLLDKKTVLWKEISKRSTGIQEMPVLPNKKLRHHVMPQF